MKINAYRFGNKSINFVKDSRMTVLKRRVISQLGSFEDYILSGVDKKTFISDGGKKQFIVEAINKLKGKSRILVLTKKEKYFIYKCGILNNICVIALEDVFPFLKGIFYCSNSEKNLLNLKMTIKKCKKHSLNLSFFIDNYNRLQKKIVRKIYKINKLDYNFFYLSVAPYQEVFKFTEENPKKEIIALDFNSMYSYSMTGLFPDPSDLEYHRIMQFYDGGINLQNGVYKVELSNPDRFINDFHSIKFVHNLKVFPFKFGEGDVVETLLTKDEIEYYSKHFKAIYLKEGITSKRDILHPLIKNRDQLFNIRLHFKKQNNEELAKLHKILLTFLHSIPNAKSSKKRNFYSLKSIVEFLDKEFGIDKSREISDAAFLMQINRASFNISIKSNKFSLTYPNYKSNVNVYSLYSYIIARARIKMMKTIEYMIQFDNLEICYTNVDSIHVSIDKNKKEEFFAYLNKANLIGNNLGQMKIEVTADKGYWLSPGRYWLLDNSDKILQSKNIGVMNKYSSNEIDVIRKKISMKKYGSELLPIEQKITLFKSHFVRKSLLTDKFERMTIDKILDNKYRNNREEIIKKLNLKVKKLISRKK